MIKGYIALAVGILALLVAEGVYQSSIRLYNGIGTFDSASIPAEVILLLATGLILIFCSMWLIEREDKKKR
jgi:hypothetical protein